MRSYIGEFPRENKIINQFIQRKSKTTSWLLMMFVTRFNVSTFYPIWLAKEYSVELGMIPKVSHIWRILMKASKEECLSLNINFELGHDGITVNILPSFILIWVFMYFGYLGIYTLKMAFNQSFQQTMIAPSPKGSKTPSVKYYHPITGFSDLIKMLEGIVLTELSWLNNISLTRSMHFLQEGLLPGS